MLSCYYLSLESVEVPWGYIELIERTMWSYNYVHGICDINKMWDLLETFFFKIKPWVHDGKQNTDTGRNGNN